MISIVSKHLIFLISLYCRNKSFKSIEIICKESLWQYPRFFVWIRFSCVFSQANLIGNHQEKLPVDTENMKKRVTNEANSALRSSSRTFLMNYSDLCTILLLGNTFTWLCVFHKKTHLLMLSLPYQQWVLFFPPARKPRKGMVLTIAFTLVGIFHNT